MAESFVQDVCALVSISIDRRDNNGFTDEQLDAFLGTCEDKDSMLIMLASYVAEDFTAESWQERLQDFYLIWERDRK